MAHLRHAKPKEILIFEEELSQCCIRPMLGERIYLGTIDVVSKETQSHRQSKAGKM